MTQHTVLITGASSGIGKSAAHVFAQAGFRVFGTSRRRQPTTRDVEMLELDVRDGASVERCVAEALTRAGRIDVLINNAGVMHNGFVEETTLGEAQAVLDANFFGVVRVTQAVLPGMRDHKQGRIINVGSLAAWIGEPGEAFYAASKAALARYTEALHFELAPLGIRVSLLEPGAYQTGILKSATVSEGSIPDYNGIRQSIRNVLYESMKQGGDPQQAAALLLHIAGARLPRLRYAAGRESWIPYLKLCSPQRLFDYLVRREYGLPSHKSETT